MPAILIVDDEFGLAEMAGDLLSSFGFAVTTAINGKLGLATLEQSRPDVILLDIMMPVMSGIEMLRALKSDENYRDIPVIMMSAADRHLLTADVMPLIAGFLQKPFAFDQLLAILRSVLPPA